MHENTTFPVKVSSQGQITLPSQLRKQLDVQKGSTRLYISLYKNTLSVTNQPPINQYYGVLKPGADQPSVTERLAELKDLEKARQSKVRS